MIELINKYWSWTGIDALEVFSANSFGNIIFKTTDGQFGRIRPEELDCKIIAENREALNHLLGSDDFLADWEMFDLEEVARKELGDLDQNEKYCLKLPGPLGGLYEPSNLGKINFEELISFSGQMAWQIKDLPDGEKFRILID